MEIPLNTTLEGLAEQLKQPVLHMEDYQYQHLDGMYFIIILVNTIYCFHLNLAIVLRGFFIYGICMLNLGIVLCCSTYLRNCYICFPRI